MKWHDIYGRERELCASQELILRVIADGRLYSYAVLIRATGKYSNLQGELHNGHFQERSLGEKGLVTERKLTMAQMGITKGFKKHVCVVQATHYAFRLLGIPEPAIFQDREAAEREFTERYKQWINEYRRDERIAKTIGLRVNQFKELRALAETPDSEVSFKEIAQRTGICSGIVTDLRRHCCRKNGSLAERGLIRESMQFTDEDKKVLTFQILAAGLILLSQAYDPGEPPPPTPKPNRGRRRLAPPIPCGDPDED